MYSIMVEATFCATHQVRYPNGELEPLHGHDWIVRAHFQRVELDNNAMVVDFDAAQHALKHIAAELHHKNLNEHPHIGEANPTAERVAKWIFDCFARVGLHTVCRVDVAEAPGCIATFEQT